MTLAERDPGVKAMGIYDIRRVIQEFVFVFRCSWAAAQPFIKGDWMGASEQCELWVAPSECCLAGVNDVLDHVIDTLISTHSGRFKVLEEYFGCALTPHDHCLGSNCL